MSFPIRFSTRGKWRSERIEGLLICSSARFIAGRNYTSSHHKKRKKKKKKKAVWGCCVVIIQRRGKRESYEAKAEQKKRKEKRKAIGPNHFSSIWRNEYAPNVSNTLFPVIHSFIWLSTVRKPVLLLLLFKRIKRDTLTLRKQRKLTRTFNDKH